MGKHSAADGAVVHPIVATALQQRGLSSGAGGDGGSPVGWPQEPRRGEGVGWPTTSPVAGVEPVAGPSGHGTSADDERTEDRHPDDDGSVLAALDEAAAADAADPGAEPAPARRSGWRRLFGGGGSSTSAA